MADGPVLYHRKGRRNHVRLQDLAGLFSALPVVCRWSETTQIIDAPSMMTPGLRLAQTLDVDPLQGRPSRTKPQQCEKSSSRARNRKVNKRQRHTHGWQLAGSRSIAASKARRIHTAEEEVCVPMAPLLCTECQEDNPPSSLLPPPPCSHAAFPLFP